MYNEPPKMSQSKKIELILLIVAMAWLLLFIFNYVRFTQSKSLFLSFHVTDDSYDDGYVEEYIGLGYIYRRYQRNAIAREELVPFWVGRENPESEDALPKAATGYEVPDNPTGHSKFRGLLYFFNIKRETLGTYKCLNSGTDCEVATSGYDYYNTLNKDPLTRPTESYPISNIHETFAFVDDSYPQETNYGNPSYTRTIYLYRFLEEDPEIIARFADVKGSTFDENTETYGGDNSKYIVKSYENNKWGLINITEKGTIEEVLPFEYESISYDIDTKYYILCKEGKWTIYDLNNDKVLSNESDDPIYDVWRNTNITYYYKTGRDRTVGNDSFVDYKIYRLDGKEFLNIDRTIEIIERENCIIYLTSADKTLHFLDYSGEERYKIPLKFLELEHTYLNNPAFEIDYELNGIMVFKIYEGREKSYSYETVSVNTLHWDYNE